MHLARKRLLLSLILALAVAAPAASAWARTSAAYSLRASTTTSAYHVFKPGTSKASGEPDSGTPSPIVPQRGLVPVLGDGSGGHRVPLWFMWIGRDWFERYLGLLR